MNDDIPALVQRLVETEQRLEELTAGEVDTVAGLDGRTFMLRRAQEQLRDSEAGKQAAILDALPAHVALLDAQGIVVSVNEAWRCFGPAQPIQRPGHEIGVDYLGICARAVGQGSSSAHQISAGIRAVLKGEEKMFSIEYPCTSPTEQGHFLLRATPLEMSRGCGAVVMHVNITQRKLAEEALRKSEQEFRSLADSLPQLVWKCRPDGWNTYFNQRWVDYTGLTLEESYGKGWLKPFHADDQRQAVEAWKDAVENGVEYAIECRLHDRDAVYRWFLVRGAPLCDETGTILWWFGTCTDIDEQKRTSEAVNVSEERFRLLSKATDDAIWDWNLANNTLWWNDSYEKLFGYDRDEAAPSVDAWTGCIHPDDLARITESVHEAIEHRGQSWLAEYRFRKRDGSYAYVLDRGYLIRDAAGKAVRMVGSMTDLTERKRAEAEREETNKQLVEASRRAGMAEVAAGVLHNVGNALNSVNVSCSVIANRVRQSRITSVTKTAELLREHANDLGQFLTTDPSGRKLPEYLTQLATRLSEEQKAVLEEVHSLDKNIEHIRAIIAMQQSHATNKGGILETLPMTELVNDAVRLNEVTLRRHRINVIRTFAEVPLVLMEKNKVLQILVNLVSNAKHALTNSDCGERQLFLGISKNNDNVDVSVRDNGTGISAENITRIFSHGFTTKKDGHGFGLHSSALAAREMGGCLGVRSNGLGTGATFTLSVPLRGYNNEFPKSAIVAGFVAQSKPKNFSIGCAM